MDKPVSFSVEAESPAGQMLMDVLYPLEQRMQLRPMKHYCAALDSIAIIPCCVSREFLQTFEETAPVRERRYISWKNRYADIRLMMDWETVIAASPQVRRQLCYQVIRDSLAVIGERCSKKGIAFNNEELLRDIFAGAD